ncbi:DNA-binding response regulator [Acinetobacter wuhouensis]|uniref:DNA-binding response regulator n=1 Tax=Acinetobacter wuhouensis TaxID=1879050 RepID=A0A385C803_9GAMM|nr:MULTISPECIES: response regulator transcription factor [Acinetobacter]AXQ23860.1 DNA-binding response regulator [Acinetobacter wuhouensis]AYO52847.1 DNA-binding response regulator [Acinetobacter wuhouensis]RZG45352.1 response regulator transcription factor [Acinetobacter wuhouensis]RZG75889.1 response regulator transcription factor [Acinetobacter wuhouensis]RZG76898.1 response regulator transcription factor [Acinetobacter sp. WCHAc060025]
MNILIVDDHPLFRHALIQAVRYSLPQAQISETAAVNEFYERLENGPEPDLVLLDLNLPGASGFSALVHVRAQYPSIPIIVVSAHEEASIIQRAIAHGAMGYIPKSAHPSHIGEAIRQVLEGDIWLPPNLPAANMNFDPRAADETALAERIQSLTPQQFRVLMMVAEGLLNKQIAYELDVSEATIKAHVTAIFRKLGVQNRTQAVLAINALNIEEKKV